METNGKLKTGILGVVALAVLVLSIVTMAVSISVCADLTRLSAEDGGAVAANGTPADVIPEEKPKKAENAPIYVLKLENGGLQVLDSTGALVRSIVCYADFLPPADREDLTEGIAVFSEEELFSLIEDFTS